MNVNKIILFGSWAMGTNSENSDVDLLVVTNDNFVFNSFKQKMETKAKYSAALDTLRNYTDIDLIVHTKPMHEKFILLDNSFRKELEHTGKIIYEAGN